MIETRPSTCRACSAYCPVLVTTDGERVLRVDGNPAVAMYGGFTCPKGRALPRLHDNPGRLLKSMKRQTDGSYKPIATDDAIAEIAHKLQSIVERHGPRSIACFLGNPGVEQVATAPVMLSLLRAIGSPMFFTMATLDQPNIAIADALHGVWDGGRMRPETLDVFLIAGGNPVISKQYFGQNPGMRLKQLVKGGCKLIVIDPRRSETARRAHIHLQPIPGQDEVIAAGLVHLVIAMGGLDEEFVAANATGLDALKEALRPFTPAYVSGRAGIAEEDLRAAASLIAQAGRGNFATGTGVSMTGRGTLATWLYNCLQTLRGFWAREGDEMLYSPVLLPPARPRAQPRPPVPPTGFGEKMRVRGLEQSAAGMPASALVDEILTPGDGQVRALFMHAGAMRTMPDEARTHAALHSLELSVTHDVEMSPTASACDYVIASRVGFEIPVLSFLVELNSSLHKGYGYPDPYGCAQPALVEPPAGSDVIDAWRLYYRLGRHLGLSLECGSMFAHGGIPLDMEREPSTEQIYELIAAGSAVPLDRVRQYPQGHVFEEARVFIAPREPDCTDRLELAAPAMLAALAEVAGEDVAARRGTDADFPLLMIPRRMQNATNGTMRLDAQRLRSSTNPAYLHPEELAARGMVPGDLAQIRSRHGVIEAVVDADADLRPGVLAIAHGYGVSPEEQGDARRHGANVNRLTSLDEDCDPYSGMPRMGAIPVSLTPVRVGRSSGQ